MNQTIFTVVLQLATQAGIPIEDINKFSNSLVYSGTLDEQSMAESIYIDCGLEPSSFNRMTPEDCIVWIKNEVIPLTTAEIHTKVTALCIPYTYPLTEDVFQKAYENVDANAYFTTIATWETLRLSVIKLKTLCHIFLLADNVKKEYRDESAAFCEMAEKCLEILCKSIAKTIDRIETERTNGKFSLVVYKNRKSKGSKWRNKKNELSF